MQGGFLTTGPPGKSRKNPFLTGWKRKKEKKWSFTRIVSEVLVLSPRSQDRFQYKKVLNNAKVSKKWVQLTNVSILR